jgi:hypothetical protein
MQTLLIAVTIGSAALALTMCAIVIRMLREERQRSNARVEVLRAMTGGSSAGNQLTEDRQASVPGKDQREPESPPTPGLEPEAVLQFSSESDERELLLHPATPVSGVDGLFAERETASPWGRRIAVAAACAAFVALGAFALGSLARDAEVPGAADSQTARGPAPLELLSLRHTARAKALTITGLVQNPRTGQTVSGVTAVAFLFAADGSFLGSGRAALDFTALKPGDESPFVVEVPAAANVARYRVSFRNEDGEVIAHVDRRGAGALAQKAERGEP